MSSTACSILVLHPSRNFCSAAFRVQLSHPYRSIDSTVASKKWSLVSRGRFDFHTLVQCLNLARAKGKNAPNKCKFAPTIKRKGAKNAPRNFLWLPIDDFRTGWCLTTNRKLHFSFNFYSPSIHLFRSILYHFIKQSCTRPIGCKTVIELQCSDLAQRISSHLLCPPSLKYCLPF